MTKSALSLFGGRWEVVRVGSSFGACWLENSQLACPRFAKSVSCEFASLQVFVVVADCVLCSTFHLLVARRFGQNSQLVALVRNFT